MTQLTFLYLIPNNISQLEPEVFRLRISIEWSLVLRENPMESPPMEIIHKGDEAIAAYFESPEGE